MTKRLLSVLVAALCVSPVWARQQSSAPRKTVLLVGSSIFHRWTNLTTQMAPLPVVNRAFDGAQTADMLATFDSLVIPSRPALIVYYCGSNDVSVGDSSPAIVDRIRRFAVRANSELPGTRMIFVSIIRAPEKQDRWRVVDEVNRQVEALATTNPSLRYVDVNPIFFSRDGAVRGELFLSDRLHLRPPAYEELARLLKPVLTKALDAP